MLQMNKLQEILNRHLTNLDLKNTKNDKQSTVIRSMNKNQMFFSFVWPMILFTMIFACYYDSICFLSFPSRFTMCFES